MRFSIRFLLILLPVLTVTTAGVLPFSESIAFAQTAELDDRKAEADRLNQQGVQQYQMSQFREALQSFQQALELYQRISDRRGESATLNNIGSIYDSLGQYEEALDYYQQSLVIRKDTGDRRGEGTTLNSIGSIYNNLGQYEEALDYYQQSLTIAKDISDRAGEGGTLNNIGYLLEAQNQTGLAIVFLKQSVNVFEQIREDLRSLSAEQQQSYTETVNNTYRKLADLLLRQNRILEAQRVLDLLKVQELDDYLRDVRGNEDTRSGVDVLRPEQEILNRYDELQKTAIQLGQELAQLQQRSRSGQTLTPTQEQRKAQLVLLQEDLNQQFREFIDRPEIQQLVTQLNTTAPQQSLNLRSFAKLQDTLQRLNAAIFYPLILDDRLELVISVPGSPPLRRTVQGVGRAQINRAILEFRQALQDPTQDAIAPATQLYQWLIAPLEEDLKNASVNTIIYAPDGQLRYIPLAALHDGEQWLVERYRLNNITAESLTDWDERPQTQPRVLAAAFADDRMGYSIQLGQRNITLRGLPFAGREISNVATLVPNTRSLLNQDFSLETIKPVMNDYSILHFATHAAFDPGNPNNSFILFGNGDRPTLNEIGNWNLSNVDLVVLSACETGVGGLGDGREVLGLGYEFQQAGAKATIASLWQVSDGGTQVLMDAFYAALDQGMTKAEALRQAQIALIADDLSTVSGQQRNVTIGVRDTRTGLPAQIRDRLSHPYYWAPFILIGNGL
ncbi:CHAT domain-containing protein [Leptolyngbya ohadii]|uniref:CHAT domain-containing protein n=1 Tax=Leptolyngbya ohadii TaxID=1962290 RepID=UPI000B5996C8|nr:CHAT domain-containing protein [Leptolyngbya ohadii]